MRQALSLVDDGGAGDVRPWSRSPIPPEHQIRGLGPITCSVPELDPTDHVLTAVMNMRRIRDYRFPEKAKHIIRVYAMGKGGPGAELHLAMQPDLAEAQRGSGGAHHVAFRTPDETQYNAWADRLNTMGIANSGKIDRYYFRSLYFREPNGILFEIASDGPGFGVDEDVATLGEKVVLAPFLEPQRAAIVANLKPID